MVGVLAINQSLEHWQAYLLRSPANLSAEIEFLLKLYFWLVRDLDQERFFLTGCSCQSVFTSDIHTVWYSFIYVTCSRRPTSGRKSRSYYRRGRVTSLQVQVVTSMVAVVVASITCVLSVVIITSKMVLAWELIARTFFYLSLVPISF